MATTFNKLAFVLLIVLSAGEVRSQNFWQSLDGPTGGRFRDISHNNTTGNSYLVTHWSVMKGNGLGSNIFYSPDDGATWTEIDAGLNSVPIYGIAHSSVNQKLVVSAMDPLLPLSPTTTTQIVFSDNNGTSWSVANTTDFPGNLPPVKMQFSPMADTLFAGQRTVGMKFSTTDGQTWNAINTGLTNLNITDLEYGNSGILFVSTDSVGVNGGKVFFLSGSSWIDVSTGLPGTRVSDLYYSSSTNTMYAGLANFQNGTGAVYQSINGGTWTILSNGYPGQEVQSVNELSNGDPIVRIPNQGIWRYTGGVWSDATSNLNSQKVSGISHDSNGELLATTLAGISKYNAGLNTWTFHTNGLYTSQGSAIAFSEMGDLIVGTDNGIYKSPDGGLTWLHKGLKDTTVMSTYLYPSDGRMFAGNTDNSGSHVFVSDDDGDNWRVSDTNYTSTRTMDFAHDSQGDIYVASGWSVPVHKSTDGVNWSGPQWSSGGFTSSTVTIGIAIDASDSIYISVEGEGVLKSSDYGSTFRWCGFSGADMTDIKISPNQSVWSTHNAPVINGGTLYQSTDGGTTWSSNLIPAVGHINSIFIASDDSIYIASTTGAWLSIDTGATWTNINSGLNPGNIVLQSMELGPDGYLYAGTGGGGIYRSINKIKTSTASLTSLNSVHEALIYPNPTRENITLRSEHQLENATLSIRNMMGQEVLHMTDIAGQQVAISIDGIAAGTYLLVVNDAGHVSTTRFIIE